MSLNDKELDDFFRDAAQKIPVPAYSSAYWNEFESKLNSEQKKTIGSWAWFSAGSVVVAALCSLLFIGNNQKDNWVVKNDESTIYNKAGQNNYALQTTLNKKINITRTSFEEDSTLNEENLFQKKNHTRVTQNRTTNSNNTSTNVVNKSIQLSNEELAKTISPLNTQKSSIYEDNHGDNLTVKKLNKTLTSTNATSLKNVLGKNKAWRFYTQLNLGVSESYNTSGGRSFTGDVSINTQRSFQKVVIRSGLGIAITTNSDISFYDRTKVYGFSSNLYTRQLSYGNLYEVYIPLELGGQLKGYTFGAGLKTNYLLGTSLDFSSFENEEVVLDESYRNIREGLDDFSFSGYIFVDKVLTERIYLGAKIGSMLTDRFSKENTFEARDYHKNSLFGQVYLKVNF